MSDTTNNTVLLEQVFRNDYQWLTDKLRRRLGCPHNAEDVASESFTQLAAIPNLPEVREPRAMLTTISNRVVFGLFRRQDLETAYLHLLAQAPEPTHPSPEQQQLLLEQLLAVDRALDRLSDKARRAFLYSQLDGLTYAQIGMRLGVSASRVRQYMARALEECYLAAGDHEQG